MTESNAKPGNEEFETPIARNIRVMAEMENRTLRERSAAQKVADSINNHAGRVWFVVVHVIWFGGWLLFNSYSGYSFDGYPFPILTLTVSLEAIFLSLFLLMSQNHATRQAERRAHFDLQVNLLAEAELTKAIKMLQALCAAKNLPEADDPELDAFQEDTSPEEVVEELKRNFPGPD